MATFYVAKTGSDSNSCAQAQNPATPKLTIGSACGCTSPNTEQTISIGPGTYAEANVGWGASGPDMDSGQDADHPSILKAANGLGTVTIKPASGNRVVVFANNDQTQADDHCRFIEFQDLILDGSNVISDVVKITNSGGTGQPAPHDIIFRNCETTMGVSPHHAQGILVSQGDHVSIIGGSVHDSGDDSGQDHLIYFSHTSFNLVDGVELYNSDGHGVQAWSDAPPAVQATNNIIRNSVVHDCERGIGVYSGDGNLIYNNIVYSNTNGIYLRNDGGSLDAPGVYNNTAYSNSSTGISIISVNAAALVKNNIAYLNSTNIDDQASSTLVDNLTTNPFFVDAAGHDFHLTSSSTGAIGQAVDLSAIFTTDQDGVTRTVPWDIGAFKYIASGSGGGGVWSGKVVFSGAVRLT